MFASLTLQTFSPLYPVWTRYWCSARGAYNRKKRHNGMKADNNTTWMKNTQRKIENNSADIPCVDCCPDYHRNLLKRTHNMWEKHVFWVTACDVTKSSRRSQNNWINLGERNWPTQTTSSQHSPNSLSFSPNSLQQTRHKNDQAVLTPSTSIGA